MQAKTEDLIKLNNDLLKCLKLYVEDEQRAIKFANDNQLPIQISAHFRKSLALIRKNK